ncbi:MAG: transposase [Bacteroidaceae bacterium]|nr:transposase [Bacteroidaceae bacterium]
MNSPEGATEQTTMASSLVKNDLHLTFHVKTGSPLIREADLARVFPYVAGLIRGLGGTPLAVGGRPDHLHALFSLPATKSLSDFVCQLKSDSSHWLKGVDAVYSHFAWQEGYGAFSMSPSLIEKTVAYIDHQAEHHALRSFREEYKMFLDTCGIQYDERNAFSD